ncbi:MAG TPA: 4Fe-4S double cluster binding domain-containing protein, partial [bacterium]|nr:4Fe-4S double cluster binding domain-containing protein [bacterium]
MNPAAEKLTSLIEERGWKGRIIPINRLADLRQAVLGRYEQALIDGTLYREQLSSFSYDPPADLPGARSVIVVAVPTPQMRLTFHWQGRAVPVVVPPTYVSYTPRSEGVRSVLAAWLKHEGYRVAKPSLPLKTLAVSSGLAEYGRNNITYVAGLGSFLQLVGAFSDLPSDGDPWRGPKALDRCETCVACLRRCPTGAITSDRFLIHAERCLTYHNEAEADFPSWIDPTWHHCLVGCMRCQIVCPENKHVVGWFEDRAEFSEQETDLLTRGTPFDRLPAETAAKLKSLEINEEYRLLCRNL